MLKLLKNKKGVSLTEVLIALAILGIIATTFISALAISSNTVIITDEKATAESIARSQLEYIQDEYELATEGTGREAVYEMLDISAQHPHYSIWSYNRDDDVVNQVIGVPWNSEDNVARLIDAGLQKVKLAIKHNDKVVFVLETYKVER